MMIDTLQVVAEAIGRVEAMLLESRKVADPRFEEMASRHAALEVRLDRLRRLVWRACGVAGVVGGVVGYLLAQV